LPLHSYPPLNLQGVPTLPELKLRFYELMIRYHSHYNNYLEMARCFRSMYETESVSGEPAQWSSVSQGRRETARESPEAQMNDD
jgi:hypothetical protein